MLRLLFKRNGDNLPCISACNAERGGPALDILSSSLVGVDLSGEMILLGDARRLEGDDARLLLGDAKFCSRAVVI